MTSDEHIQVLNLVKNYFHDASVTDAMDAAIDAMKAMEFFRWHDLRDDPYDLPMAERPVVIAYIGWNNQIRTARAIHEDGKVHSEASVFCGAEDLSEWCEYCEETDDYIIPECWIEDVSFGETCSIVDRTVIAWRERQSWEN